MATYNFKPVTYDGKNYFEATGTCTLKSLTEKVLENVNGTEYRLGSIEFENAAGQKTQASAMIYEKNYVDENGDVRMAVDQNYLMTIRVTPERPQEPLIFVSHLEQLANRASATEFGFSFEGVVTPKAVETTVPADDIVAGVF
jgi:hypothetical protein